MVIIRAGSLKVLHIRSIIRYPGDVENLQTGVRNLIAKKAHLRCYML